MLAHLATFAGTPCHFASDDGARLYDLSRLRRLPHEFDLIVYNFRVNGADAAPGVLAAAATARDAGEAVVGSLGRGQSEGGGGEKHRRRACRDDDVVLLDDDDNEKNLRPCG